MQAILFSRYFEAPDELNEFCKERLSNLWHEKVYKGERSAKFKIGFAGAGYIREIDTTKKWRLKYNNVDAPIIDYVDIKVNNYGYVSIISIK